MNLLMITRKIDRNDWLAGHGYEWAKKISEKLKANNGKLSVICLEKGNTHGLEDVEVFSLGKETGASRLRRLWTLQKLAYKIVPKVDGIFCHQNPEYAIAIAPLSKIFHKKIVSWYTHKSVTWKTRLMTAVSSVVLTASKESFRLQSSKARVVGHGIDTNVFAPLPAPGEEQRHMQNVFRVISVGRISPVKNLETLILAADVLVNRQNFSELQVGIVGDVGMKQQRDYLESLRNLVSQHRLGNFVHFKPAVPHHRVHMVYQTANLFVNLSQTGSLDKAVLEAMACECVAITSNEAFFEMFRPYAGQLLVHSGDHEELADKIKMQILMNRSQQEVLGAALRRIVLENHSLDKLAEKIVKSFLS